MVILKIYKFEALSKVFFQKERIPKTNQPLSWESYECPSLFYLHFIGNILLIFISSKLSLIVFIKFIIIFKQWKILYQNYRYIFFLVESLDW